MRSQHRLKASRALLVLGTLNRSYCGHYIFDLGEHIPFLFCNCLPIHRYAKHPFGFRNQDDLSQIDLVLQELLKENENLWLIIADSTVVNRDLERLHAHLGTKHEGMKERFQARETLKRELLTARRR